MLPHIEQGGQMPMEEGAIQGITICGRRPEYFEWKQFYINKDDLKQEVEKRMS